ncbi:MAG: hypothetical protein PHN32_07775 [Actinomycetota bacterium]|nr:hypothetical protein [Actinomycetota bacterium]
MAKQLLIHALPSPIPIAQAEQVAKVAKSLSDANAYWVSSWIQLDDKGDVVKIFCEYDAKDADSLGKLVAEMGKQFTDFPCEGPFPLMKVEGESYR